MAAEREIEAYLRDRVKALGGRAYKWVSPGNSGVPDRIVMLPGGVIAFVELKAPGKTSGPLQKRQQSVLAGMGFAVYRDVDSKAAVERVLGALQMQRYIQQFAEAGGRT